MTQAETHTTKLLPEVNAFLERRHGLWISGRWVESSNPERLTTENPATEEIIAEFASAGNRTSISPSLPRRRALRRRRHNHPATRLFRQPDSIHQRTCRDEHCAGGDFRAGALR